MLHRIIGRAGSGKTTYLLAVLREALQDGADCIVLVPEQAVAGNRAAAERDAGRRLQYALRGAQL